MDRAEFSTRVAERVEDFFPTLFQLFALQNGALFTAFNVAVPFDQCDRIGRGLVAGAAHYGWIFRLFAHVSQYEVAQATSLNTIFREDSLGTKMMYQVVSDNMKPPLVTFVRPLVKKLIKNFKHVDLAAEDIANNDKRDVLLVRFVEEVLLQLCAISEQCNFVVRTACQSLHDNMSQHFPCSSNKILGAVIFLRFLCPAIATAHSFFNIRNPKPKDRKVVLLASKLIQTFVSGAESSNAELKDASIMLETPENNNLLRAIFSGLSSTSTSQLGAKSDSIMDTIGQDFFDETMFDMEKALSSVGVTGVTHSSSTGSFGSYATSESESVVETKELSEKELAEHVVGVAKDILQHHAAIYKALLLQCPKDSAKAIHVRLLHIIKPVILGSFVERSPSTEQDKALRMLLSMSSLVEIQNADSSPPLPWKKPSEVLTTPQHLCEWFRVNDLPDLSEWILENQITAASLTEVPRGILNHYSIQDQRKIVLAVSQLRNCEKDPRDASQFSSKAEQVTALMEAIGRAQSWQENLSRAGLR